MSMDFELKIDKKDMSRFLLRFNYTKLSGILGILLGVASLVALGIRWGGWTGNQKIMLVVIAFLFLVFQPLMLVKKAKAQVAQMDTGEPLMCHIDEKHISVSMGEESSGCEWNNIRKVVYGKDVVYVFTSAIHATIVTRKACGDRFDELVSFLKGRKKS